MVTGQLKQTPLADPLQETARGFFDAKNFSIVFSIIKTPKTRPKQK